MKKPRTPWTPEQLAILIARYPHEKTEVVAVGIGRPIHSVYNKAFTLGLVKSAEYLASPAACRLRRGDNVGAAYRFHAEQTPWNKGASFNAGGRSVETRFKPGAVPPNRQPVGTTRITKDGYLEIKTEPGMHKWILLHRWNWKLATGEYPPKGMALVFKDGNKKNCAIDNLELITRADLMRRNNVHNYPPEIAKAIQLVGALNRKINAKHRNAT